MAIGSIGGISVKIRADVDGFQADLNRASASISKAARKIRSGANEYGRWAAAGTAAAAAVGAAMVKHNMKTIDALAKTADRLGLTTEALAGLQRSAKLSGADVGTMNMALQRMTRRVSEAAQGSGEAQGALKELGIDAQALSQLTPDEQFRRVADAMQGVSEQGDRVRLSMRLFDSEGVKLLNTLEMGSDALEEQEEIARKLGTALNRMDAAKVEQANDAMSTAGEAIDGVVNRLAVQLSPLIEQAANQFTDAALEGEGFGDTISKSISVATKIIGVFANGIHGIKVVLKGVEVAAASFRAAWLEAMRIMTAGMEQFVNVAINSINKLIEGINLIPGMSIEPIQKFTFGAAKLFTRLADEAGGALKNSLGEWHDMAMQPLPSDQLDAWVAKAQEAGEKVGAALGGGEEEGGEGGSVGLSEADRKAMDERIAAIQESLKTEQQLKAEAYLADLAALDRKRQMDVENKAKWDQMEKDLAAKHQSDLVDIEQKAAAKRQDLADQERRKKVSGLSGMFGDLSSLMNTESRKMFEIGKAASLAQAVVDGYAAITGAYKNGASIGGPPLGAAFAAAAGAATFAQIQQIKNTKFGSAGAGQSIQGGQVVNNTGSQQGSQQTVRREIDLNFTGGSVNDPRALAEMLNEAAGDGVQFNINNG